MSKRQKDILERVKNKKSGANEFVNAISSDSKNTQDNNDDNNLNAEVDTNIDSGDDTNINNDNENVDDNNYDIITNTMNVINNKYTKKKNTKTQTGFYIDADNKRNLDNFAKKYGKGVKSELVNKLLRSFFENN